MTAAKLSVRALKTLKAVVFTACLFPALQLAWDATRGGLTANPIEDVTHRTGYWTLTLLLVTLSVTPLRRITRWNQLIRIRRTLGLFAFFYAVLHFSTYIVLDQFFAWSFIIEDIAERPYITVGFTAFVLLIPLAVTSTSRMIRRLGGRRWARLHSMIYVIATLGVLHFLWLVKADTSEPLRFAAILVILLGLQLVGRRVSHRSLDPRRARATAA